MAAVYDFDSPEFDEAMRAAGRKAFAVPDGRKFEIRWIPGASAGENYKVLREVTAHTA